MKIDTYTKIVLTAIAISLSVIALKDVNLVNTAIANSNEASWDNIMEVRVVEWKVREDIDVNIADWEVTEEIDVNIDEVGGRYIYDGKLKVILDN